MPAARSEPLQVAAPVAARRVSRAVATVALLAGVIAGPASGLDDPAATHAAPTNGPTIEERLARALAYEHGEGLPKDPLVAAALYCDAAQAGDAEAAYRLGWMYAYGRGVIHDDATASALFELAASEGHTFARDALKHMGDVHGILPDCMSPPRPLSPDPVVADDDTDDPFVDLPPYKQKIADLVDRLAPHYGIEPRLALAVIAVESNFDALARSAKDARGLMQLVPETAVRFKVRNAFDMVDNVRGGLSYLRWLLAYYRGEVRLAAAAYNAGERAVDRYRGVPPYPETRDYVQHVMQLFRDDHHPYNPQVVAPSAIVARSRDNPG